MAEREKNIQICKDLLNLTSTKNAGKSMQIKIKSDFIRFLCENISEICKKEENAGVESHARDKVERS